MALESFLINPARIRRKRRVKSRRSRKGGLPGGLLSRMMSTYGPRKGMKEAWRAYRKGVTRNVPGLGLLSNRRKRRSRKRRSSNPFGEEVMVVGNPARKRRKRRVRARVRRPRRRSFLKRILGGLGRIRRPRRARRRKARVAQNFMANPRRRRRRYRRRNVMAMNPRRRKGGRRARRGGAIAAALPALSFTRPMQLLVPLAVGTAGYMAADQIPIMAKITGTLPRLGVKAAVGIGGGMLIGKFLGRQNAAVWTIGVGINLLSDVLKTYVFKTQLATAGYGAFPYQEYGAYPDEFSGYPTGESYPY